MKKASKKGFNHEPHEKFSYYYTKSFFFVQDFMDMQGQEWTR